MNSENNEWPKYYGSQENKGRWLMTTDSGMIVPFDDPDGLRVEDEVGECVDWYVRFFKCNPKKAILLPMYNEKPLIYKE